MTPREERTLVNLATIAGIGLIVANLYVSYEPLNYHQYCDRLHIGCKYCIPSFIAEAFVQLILWYALSRYAAKNPYYKARYLLFGALCFNMLIDLIAAFRFNINTVLITSSEKVYFALCLFIYFRHILKLRKCLNNG